MRNPEYRFVMPDAERAAYKASIVWEDAGSFRHDYLRSYKHAQQKHVSNLKGPHSDFYQAHFSECGSKKGYSDAIGFECGQHRESAACPICRWIQRLQLADIPRHKKLLDKDCTFITIFDDRKRVGKLHEHQPKKFISALDDIAKEVASVGSSIKAIGHLEYALKPSRKKKSMEPEWTPHIHIIAFGSGVEEFVTLCRDRFRSDAKGIATVQADLINSGEVEHTFAYAFKAPFAKNQDRVDFVAEREVELSRHLLDRTCSELLWSFGMYIPGRKVIAPKRDIIIWNHTLGIYKAFQGSKKLRVIPKVAAHLKLGLFNVDGELCKAEIKKRCKMITEELLDQIKSSHTRAYRVVRRRLRGMIDKNGKSKRGVKS